MASYFVIGWHNFNLYIYVYTFYLIIYINFLHINFLIIFLNKFLATIKLVNGEAFTMLSVWWKHELSRHAIHECVLSINQISQCTNRRDNENA